MDLQRFIADDVSMSSMAYAIGLPQPQAQEVRDWRACEGAVGVIVGVLAKAP